MMALLDFKNYSLWMNIAVFTTSAIVVWIAGTLIARYADKIATKSGIGHAAVGLVLLAGITSLPEVAVSATSAMEGHANLAVNNLLGSIAMQITIIAAADAILDKEALTVIAASPLVMQQVALNALLLALVAAAITVGDVMFFHVGVWSWGMLVAYAFAIWKLSNSQGRQYWIAKKTDGQKAEEKQHPKKLSPAKGRPDGASNQSTDSLKTLGVKTAVAGASILAAGFLLSHTGSAIAAQTGLGQSFVGAVLIAISTSLPELSSVFSSVRLGRYEMAIADIFGTNLLNVGLIFFVDALYAGGPALNEVGPFSLFAALLGIALASIYLVGLIDRRDRTIARMGIDSFFVLITYIGGLFMLYRLR